MSMSIELRPSWCVTGEAPEQLALGPWIDDLGQATNSRDGDDWHPGQVVVLTRDLGIEDPGILRRQLGVRPEIQIGVAARWYCQATGESGTHENGPAPVPLPSSRPLAIEIPGRAAATVELETCLVASWSDSASTPDAAPDGGVIWSDAWSRRTQPEPLVLEGSELRIPVRTVSFAETYPETKSAMWAIELDSVIEPEDLVQNVCTVLLNADVLDREFRGPDGTGDAAMLPDSIIAGVTVDLLRTMISTVQSDLTSYEFDPEAPAGSVKQLLGVRLVECFGNVETARRELEEDSDAFSRRLWSRFAPDSWAAAT